VLAHIAGGSGQELTLAANTGAFAAWSVRPRLLRDVSAGHLRVRLQGREWPAPLLLAPVALQKLAHPEGELATARAAAATGCCLVASTMASCTLEEIARVAGPGHWFQLYVQPRRQHTAELVRRAEQAGYAAIVVTLDAPVQPVSLRALRSGFRVPADCEAANLHGHAPPPQATLPPGSDRILNGLMRGAPTWDELAWLRAQTTLPVWVKGVMHPEDARQLMAAGIAGVVVSNHGGRALDGASASLDALPDIRRAVAPDYPLLFDGGIRSGSDVLKALALGADAVLIGRLQIYALAVAGALGVAHLLRLLSEELAVGMALAGCATLADIRQATLQRGGQC